MFSIAWLTSSSDQGWLLRVWALFKTLATQCQPCDINSQKWNKVISVCIICHGFSTMFSERSTCFKVHSAFWFPYSELLWLHEHNSISWLIEHLSVSVYIYQSVGHELDSISCPIDHEQVWSLSPSIQFSRAFLCIYQSPRADDLKWWRLACNLPTLPLHAKLPQVKIGSHSVFLT